MEYQYHKWSLICSPCHNPYPVLHTSIVTVTNYDLFLDLWRGWHDWCCKWSGRYLPFRSASAHPVLWFFILLSNSVCCVDNFCFDHGVVCISCSSCFSTTHRYPSRLVWRHTLLWPVTYIWILYYLWCTSTDDMYLFFSLLFINRLGGLAFEIFTRRVRGHSRTSLLFPGTHRHSQHLWGSVLSLLDCMTSIFFFRTHNYYHIIVAGLVVPLVEHQFIQGYYHVIIAGLFVPPVEHQFILEWFLMVLRHPPVFGMYCNYWSSAFYCWYWVFVIVVVLVLFVFSFLTLHCLPLIYDF